MSVYTPLSLAQVQHFAQPYALDISGIQPIQGGMENTNYFLTTSNGTQYVLTVFEELDQHAAAELIPVLQHLIQHGIPVAMPLQYSGQAIHFIANKPAQIAPRLLGQHPISPSIQQVETMGKTLAQLHVALQTLPLQRQNQHGQSWWKACLSELKTEITQTDLHMIEHLFQRLYALQAQHPDRPKGLIHADLFRDNSLFEEATLTGLLDFSELTYDELLCDIAITINDFCSDFPNVQLDHDKKQAFLNAYHTVRPLTSDEHVCFPLYLALAACRFWLARLHVAKRNHIEARIGTHILQKDPNEMRLMMLDRLTQQSTN